MDGRKEQTNARMCERMDGWIGTRIGKIIIMNESKKGKDGKRMNESMNGWMSR